MAFGISPSEYVAGRAGCTIYYGSVGIFHVGLSDRVCISVCEGVEGRRYGGLVGDVYRLDISGGGVCGAFSWILWPSAAGMTERKMSEIERGKTLTNRTAKRYD